MYLEDITVILLVELLQGSEKTNWAKTNAESNLGSIQNYLVQRPISKVSRHL